MGPLHARCVNLGPSVGADKFRVRIRTGIVPCPGLTEDAPIMDNNKARTFIF